MKISTVLSTKSKPMSQNFFENNNHGSLTTKLHKKIKKFDDQIREDPNWGNALQGGNDDKKAEPIQYKIKK